ncbi:hypothetical protein H2204_004258 [Knufia peltigerae]|uniref:Laccase n=1 Tax=Knufia peltigerae TaxID=1002370 RepID=A0AA38Y7L3_9EURO|nr:hypothetical protein H2204_004258 [Knufia peltigerae]
MAPIGSFWTGVTSLFGLLTNSPGWFFDSTGTNNPGLQVPIQPPVRPEAAKHPIFHPPDDLEGAPFRCDYPDYPESQGWVACNTRNDRQCWIKNTKTGQRFDIHTDYENNGPKGIERHYYLELEETLSDPDGFGSLPAQLFNGSFPGPRLQACWGDKLIITVKNKLTGEQPYGAPGNGTSVHWHGVRQLNTGHMDGVNAVTQCPIAPGQEFTYVFNATQYGTTWYHSHYSLQYAAGAMGPLTIYGPASRDFDHQLYPIIMSDWLHQSPYQKWDVSIKDNGSQVFVDNILQNGIGHWPPLKLDSQEDSQTVGKPKFNQVMFQKGVRYLMRLINGAADTTFVFSIDNHKFWVISTDFVAIEPYYTDHVVVGIGQRYNIIVEAIPDRFTADQSYWIRTSPAPNCTSFSPSAPIPDEHTGIVRYTFDDDRLPTTPRNKFTLTCADETYYRNISPVVPWQVGTSRHEMDPFYLTYHQLKQSPYYPCDKQVGRFELVSGHPMWLNFSGPTLLNLHEDFSEKPWLAVVETGEVPEDQWIQLTVISGARKKSAPLLPHPVPKVPGVFVPGEHPIHLHGHDFAILDQCVPDGHTECDVSKANLTLDNPPRRDVAFLPDKGYLIVAFKADNPGVWIMHCHIAFHASSGLAAQIVENPDKINFPLGWDEPFFDMCRRWDDWRPKIHDPSDPCMKNHPDLAPLQVDSGI